MTHSSITIRKGEAKDASYIADIGHRAFAAAFRNEGNSQELQHYIDTEYCTEAIAQRMRQQDIHHLVCTNEQGIIGFAELHERAPQQGPESCLMLDRLYIEPSLIGTGLGHRILTDAEQFSRDADKVYLWLMVLRPNRTAFQFYLDHGYTVFGESPGKFKADAAMDDWMIKKL